MTFRTVALALLLTGGVAVAAPKDSRVERLSRDVGRALSGRSAQDIATITRRATEAYGRGASSHELVNLVEDLNKDGVAAPGILNAIEAVGRLAEEGYDDAETRRGVALTVLQNLRDGVRGRELADAIREETRDAKDDAERGEHGGGNGASANGNGRGRSSDDKGKSEIRDDLRRNPPKGAPADRGPSNRDKTKPDKGKPDNAGPKK